VAIGQEQEIAAAPRNLLQRDAAPGEVALGVTIGIRCVATAVSHASTFSVGAAGALRPSNRATASRSFIAATACANGTSAAVIAIVSDVLAGQYRDQTGGADHY
jgi:hypothetical protein